MMAMVSQQLCVRCAVFHWILSSCLRQREAQAVPRSAAMAERLKEPMLATAAKEEELTAGRRSQMAQSRRASQVPTSPPENRPQMQTQGRQRRRNGNG